MDSRLEQAKEWVDAEKVRELIDNYKYARDSNAEGTEGWVINHLMVSNLESLIPTPPLPTLAGMTPEEREACRWMQAQTWYEVGIIVWMDEMTEIAQLITRANGVLERKFKDVTPLPDLPKLEWPGSHADTITAESVDDMQAGRVVDFEPALPRPEDVPSGEAWLVRYKDRELVAYKADLSCVVEPWTVYLSDEEGYWWLSDADITLVSRLVPEHKENA